MKICYVLDDTIYRWGGAQTYVLGLAHSLVNKNHEVTILTSRNDSVRKREIDPRIEVVEISTGKDIKSFSLNGSFSPFPGFADTKLVREILINEKFDVIHFNYPFSPFVSGEVIKVLDELKRRDARFCVPTLFCTFHIHAEEKLIPRVGNHILSFIQRKLTRKINHFIHISKATKEYGEKYVKVSSSYLPIGLPSVEIHPKPQDKVNLFFMARHEERKGVLDFIQALSVLKNKNPDALRNCAIDIAGDGPQRNEAENLAAKHDLNINFHGKVSEEKKDELYKNAHVAIFPAKFGESFGVVLLEAMNYSCAIVGYANHGYADTMQQFSEECLAEVENIEELAEKIMKLTIDKSFAAEQGRRLKEYFEERFSLESVTKKLVEMYVN